MNIGVHVSVGSIVFSGYTLSSQRAGYCGSFIPSILKESPYYFPQWLHHFTFFRTYLMYCAQNTVFSFYITVSTNLILEAKHRNRRKRVLNNSYRIILEYLVINRKKYMNSFHTREQIDRFILFFIKIKMSRKVSNVHASTLLRTVQQICFQRIIVKTSQFV